MPPMETKTLVFLVSNDLNSDQRMHRICSTMTDAAYQVILVGRMRRNSMPVKDMPFRQVRLRCGAENGPLFYAILNLRLLWYLLWHRFDAVCAIDLDTLLPAMLVSRLKRKALVYDAHEYFTEVPEVINRPRVQAVWRWIERYCIPRTAARYTVSRGIAKLFEQRYGLPFAVVRNVPLPNGTPAIETKDPFLLYQGALNEGRGLEAMLLAMYEIDIPLYLAGEGDLSQYIRHLVQKMDLGGKVQFLGILPPEELHKLTRQATVGINLLENKGLSYYHSLSNKFFDYVQAGVPQLCIAFPEYVRHNREFEVAVLVDDLKTVTLVRAIRSMLSDKSLYNSLHQNCLKAREEWQWEKEKEVLLDVYRGLGL
jgi:glycosyltransferase involved in cell wall biosynthesis